MDPEKVWLSGESAGPIFFSPLNLQQGPPSCPCKINPKTRVPASYTDQSAQMSPMVLPDLDGCAGGTMTAVMTLLAKEEGVTGIKAQVRILSAFGSCTNQKKMFMLCAELPDAYGSACNDNVDKIILTMGITTMHTTTPLCTLRCLQKYA